MQCRRLNMYTEIHKGVRRALFEVVMDAGALDLAEPEGLEELQRVWEELTGLLREHVENERRYVHPLYQERMPGVARALTAEHEEQEANLAELQAHLARLKDLEEPVRRVAMGLEFYRRLNLFVADYLPHLQREEAVYMRNLWDLFSDQELREVLARILNNESYDDAQVSGRLIVQASNHQDLMDFMGAIHDLLEPRVIEQMMQVAQQYLPPHELEKLQRAMAEAQAEVPV
jgi:hypothetical protein